MSIYEIGLQSLVSCSVAACQSWNTSCCTQSMQLQELVEIVGRSKGIALMAPPSDSDAAQKTLDTLMSAVTKKQKVRLLGI